MKIEKNIMQKKINNFLEYLEVEKGLSLITIKNYSFYLNRFADYAKSNSIAAPEKITKELVQKYRLWLNRLTDTKGENLKKNTQNYHLIALRGFLKYLAKNDIKTLAPEKIELAKQEQRQVSFLEGSDLSRILEAPFQIKLPEIIRKRDKAILELFFSTGLRVSELTKLKMENLNLMKDEFTVRGKGSKLRVVFLSPDAKKWIKEYLDARQDVNPFLFISHDKAASGRDEQNCLTPRSVQRLVEKYAKVAGITKRVTPHTMRHSYATDLLINGADIRSVQAMLGHSSITTTQVYTHITDQQLRDVYKAFHGKKRKI
jgi:site-specific recombinase XerD